MAATNQPPYLPTATQVDEVQRAYTTKRAHLEQLRRQLLHRAVIMRRGSLGLISQGSSSGRLETMPSGEVLLLPCNASLL